MKGNKIVYIAGPYSGVDREATKRHIRDAREAAILCSNVRVMFFCPHTHTANFDSHADSPELFYINMDLEFLQRCDGMLMLPTWYLSRGAQEELKWWTSNRSVETIFYMREWEKLPVELIQWYFNLKEVPQL